MAFLTKSHLSRRTFLRGVGVTLALPLLDSMIPAATALGQTARRAANPARRDLLPARRDHDANGRRRRRAPASSSREILQPLKPFYDQINIVSDLRHAQRLRQRRHRQSQPLGRRLPQRRVRRDRRAAAARHHRRSGRGAEDRAGHAAAVARADDRRAEPELRRRPELLVSRHDLVAGPARAAADAEQSAGRLRAPVRRRQHRTAAQGAARAVDQPARLGAGRSRLAAEQAPGRRPHAPRPVSEDVREIERRVQKAGQQLSDDLPVPPRRPACRRTSRSTSS